MTAYYNEQGLLRIPLNSFEQQEVFRGRQASGIKAFDVQLYNARTRTSVYQTAATIGEILESQSRLSSNLVWSQGQYRNSTHGSDQLYWKPRNELEWREAKELHWYLPESADVLLEPTDARWAWNKVERLARVGRKEAAIKAMPSDQKEIALWAQAEAEGYPGGFGLARQAAFAALDALD